MGGAAAVSIHDDLAAGEAGVRGGAALDEASGGVHVILGILIQHIGGDDYLSHLLDHILANLLQGDIRVVLGGDDHGIHPDGAVVLVILHGDLALAVGTHVGQQAALANLRHAQAQLLGQGQRQGHQLRCLVAGVTEHHALVSRAVGQLAVCAGLALQRFVHAQGDVRGLFVDGGDDAAGIAVKAVLATVIADLPHHFPGDLGDIHIAGGGDLAHHMDEAGAGCGLAGHAAHGILGQDGIQDGVGNLIADLVGMSFRHRFRGKQVVSCHRIRLLLFVPLPSDEDKKHARFDDETRKRSLFRSSSVGIRRIWHLEKTGCRGFIGPFPPPLLIRDSIFISNHSRFWRIVKV